jgi:adenylylsulfate kinase-like enzyme
MVVWLIGLSGAGKTTVGRELAALLEAQGRPVVFLDGDRLRDVWHDNLGHTIEARRTNHQRISSLSALLGETHGIDVVAAVLSIFPDLRAWNRANIEGYFEVFLDLPLAEAMKRDTKGLYAKARAGEMRDVVGVDIPFPPPERPDMHITDGDILAPPAEIARSIVARLDTVRAGG